MDAIRIIHREEPGYGWSFDSPDLPGMVGGGESYEESRRLAEEAVRFHLHCESVERRAPETPDVRIEHYVPAPA